MPPRLCSIRHRSRLRPAHARRRRVHSQLRFPPEQLCPDQAARPPVFDIHGGKVVRALAASLLAVLAIGLTATPARSQTFVYVTNQRANNVSGYVLNPSTGALTP